MVTGREWDLCWRRRTRFGRKPTAKHAKDSAKIAKKGTWRNQPTFANFAESLGSFAVKDF